MPIVSWACPPDKPTVGEVHTTEHCITKCTHRCYSPYLMAAIAASNQKNHHKGKYLSATSLSGCVRKLCLERRVPYAEMYKNMFAAFRGTMTHTVLEEAATVVLGDGKSLGDYGFLSEWRMQIGFCFVHGGFPIPPDIDPSDTTSLDQIECPDCMDAGVPLVKQECFILGGTLDGAEPVLTGEMVFDAASQTYYPEITRAEDGSSLFILHDLKTFKSYATRLFILGDPKNSLHPTIKDAYVIQARIYAYLASRCLPPPVLRQRGVTRLRIVESHIQGYSMEEAPWTGGGTFRWKDHYRHPYKDYPMYGIDLSSDEWIEAYIRKQARPIYDAFILEKERGTVVEEGDEWLCKVCAFYGSSYCPNPQLEYRGIQEGADPEEAFRRASEKPVEIPEEDVAPLTDKDTAHIDAFFARQARKV